VPATIRETERNRTISILRLVQWLRLEFVPIRHGCYQFNVCGSCLRLLWSPFHKRSSWSASSRSALFAVPSIIVAIPFVRSQAYFFVFNVFRPRELSVCVCVCVCVIYCTLFHRRRERTRWFSVELRRDDARTDVLTGVRVRIYYRVTRISGPV